MELDGKKYEMQYLTHLEKAVVDAMRMGGKVDVRLHGSHYENAMANFDSLPSGVLKLRKIVDLTDGANSSFVMFEAYDREGNNITHYVRATRKATDGNQ